MDWREPGKAMITVASTHVLAIIVHTILFYIYRTRVFIQRRCRRNTLILPTTSGDVSSLTDSRVSMVFGGPTEGCNNAGFTGGSEKGKI